MSEEQLEPQDRDDHPVLSGLVALLAVAVVVGLILGGGALAATKVLGINGDANASSRSSAKQTLVLPKPSKTDPSDDDPLITLAPDTSGPSTTLAPLSTSPSPSAISLSAGQTEVGQMEPIDLTGTYTGGEGAILQVQQFSNGGWSDFPVTAPVSGETFTTFIQASAIGLNRFRVVDTDTGLPSNEVRVRIG